MKVAANGAKLLEVGGGKVEAEVGAGWVGRGFQQEFVTLLGLFRQ